MTEYLDDIALLFVAALALAAAGKALDWLTDLLFPVSGGR